MTNPLGISTSLFGGLLGLDCPESALAVLHGTAIRHIEYMCVDDQIARYEDDEHVARTKEVVVGNGLAVWSVHAPFWHADLSALDEAQRRQAVERCVRAMQVANALEAGIVVVHGSREPVEEHERQSRLIACVRSLNELCKRASQRGLVLALETLPRSCLGNRVAEVRWLLDLVDGDLRVCYDVNHVTLYEDVRESLRALQDRLTTLHISDHDGVNERHWIPGRGVVDWQGFREGLQEIGYQGCLMHEAMDGDATLEQNLILIEQAARETLGWKEG